MNLSRRQFIEKSGHGVIGTAVLVATVGSSAFLLEGCAFSVQTILNWTNVGAGLISSVLSLLMGAGLIACLTCSVLGNDALAAISAIATAVQNYLNADPSTKTTLLGKIQDALSAASAAVTQFFKSLSIPGSSLASLIIGIAGLVLNAIAGFISQIGTPAARSAMEHRLTVNGQVIEITPTVMTYKQLQAAANKLFVQYGHPEQVMHY